MSTGKKTKQEILFINQDNQRKTGEEVSVKSLVEEAEKELSSKPEQEPVNIIKEENKLKPW